MNRPTHIKKVEWRLNPNQRFNLEIIKIYIQEQSRKPVFDSDTLRAQLIRAGWDIAVIDVAFCELGLKLSGEHTLSDP